MPDLNVVCRSRRPRVARPTFVLAALPAALFSVARAAASQLTIHVPVLPQNTSRGRGGRLGLEH